MLKFKTVFLVTVLLFTFGTCNLNCVAAQEQEEGTASSIDVTAFGAKGDGINDDTTAFANALALLDKGQTLRVPAGVYNVDNLTLPSNIKIKGDDNAVLKGTVAGGTILNISAATGIDIKHLIINGDLKSRQAIEITQSSSDINIEGCEIKNTYGTSDMGSFAIEIYVASNITINNCYFHDISADNDNDVTITDGNIAANRGIRACDVETMEITNCTFEDISGFKDGDVIQITKYMQTSSDYNANVIIKGCMFKNFYKRAIKVQAPGVNILHNTMIACQHQDDNFQVGISAFDNNVNIEGNTIVLYHTTSAIQFHGINGRAYKNKISVAPGGSNSKPAIYMADATSHITIESNIIHGITVEAIELSSQATDVVSVYNKIF